MGTSRLVQVGYMVSSSSAIAGGDLLQQHSALFTYRSRIRASCQTHIVIDILFVDFQHNCACGDYRSSRSKILDG